MKRGAPQAGRLSNVLSIVVEVTGLDQYRKALGLNDLKFPPHISVFSQEIQPAEPCMNQEIVDFARQNKNNQLLSTLKNCFEYFLKNRYTVKCLSCVPPQQDADRMILDGNHCRSLLRRDQHGARGWLGRAVLPLKQHELNPEQEILVAPERIRMQKIHFTACQRLFNANRGNYAQAGNMDKDENGARTSDPLYHHPHSHVLPRYEKEILWRGKKFVDHTFSDPMSLDPTPTDREKDLNTNLNVNIPLTPEELGLLKEDLQMELVRMMFDRTVLKILQPAWFEIAAAFPSERVIALYQQSSKSKEDSKELQSHAKL